VIGKITGGASFAGALEYLTKIKEPKLPEEKEPYRQKLKEAKLSPGEHAPPFEAGERHRVIGGNMSGLTREELQKEFEAICGQRPDIEKPVHHVSLSAGENDRLSVEQWQEISERYIHEMGFKDAPYVVIQHRDGAHDHVHILTSRVDVNGHVVSDWQSKQRAEKVLRGVERDYGLEQTKSSTEVERAAPKRGEIEVFNRTRELSARMEMQSHVDLALQDNPSATAFIERLQNSGIEVVPYVQDSGLMTGISFRKGKELMKGSDLGRGFSWPALQRRGLDYQPERDRPAVEAARERSALEEHAQPTGPSTVERNFGDAVRDIGERTGQYLIDQANPLRPLENQVRAIEVTGRALVDGVTALRDTLSRQSDPAQPQRAAGPEPDGRDSIQRLQQTTGLETARDGQGALEHLNEIAGPQRPDSAEPSLEDSLTRTPGMTPSQEIANEEHTIEQAIEFIL
jgi:hypothetical protein